MLSFIFIRKTVYSWDLHFSYSFFNLFMHSSICSLIQQILIKHLLYIKHCIKCCWEKYINNHVLCLSHHLFATKVYTLKRNH